MHTNYKTIQTYHESIKKLQENVQGENFRDNFHYAPVRLNQEVRTAKQQKKSFTLIAIISSDLFVMLILYLSYEENDHDITSSKIIPVLS